MLIFYGLGNNEAKYLNTKHNIGRVVVEDLATKIGVSFSDSGHGCMVAKGKFYNIEIWLVYSKGYMNLSGEPISKLIKYFKLEQSNFNLTIIQDDSDQITCNNKLVSGGGSAGHNGIISSYLHLSNLVNQSDIWRLKIGIRPDGNKLQSINFVLSSFSLDESTNTNKLSQVILDNLESFENKNLNKLQNIIHTKELKI